MDEMTTPEVNQYLETIAKLIEKTLKDEDPEVAEKAAQIVRESKIKA